jgi:hypothetical protein
MGACSDGANGTDVLVDPPESTTPSSSVDEIDSAPAEAPAEAVDEEAVAFCMTLEDGLESFVSTNDGDPFVALLTNISETNRLIANLAQDPPSDIAADMKVVAQNWEEQTDLASGAASDPLGAFAGALVSSLISSRSYQVVDDYALEQCGRPVFGLARTSAGSNPCAWLERDEFSETVKRAPVAALQGALDTIVQSSPGAADKARTILDQLAQLEPPARYGNEAIQRLRLQSKPVVTDIIEIDQSLTTECGYGAFESDNLVADMATAVQGLGDDRWVTEPFAGCRMFDADSDVTWSYYIQGNALSGIRFAYTCENADEFAVLDLATGDTAWIDEQGGRLIGVASDTVFFERSVDVPASGLDPATRQQSIVAYSASTGTELGEIPYFDGDPDEAWSPIFVHAAGGNALIVLPHNGELRQLVVVGPDGAPLFDRTYECREAGKAWASTNNSVLVSDCEGRQIMVNVATAEIADVPVDVSAGSANALFNEPLECPSATVNPVRRSDLMYVMSDVADETSLLTFQPPPEAQGSDAVVVGDVVVFGDFDQELGRSSSRTGDAFGVRLDGSLVWAYPRTDFELAWYIIGDHLLAINEAGEQIFVNPSTGEPLDQSPPGAVTVLGTIGRSSGDDPIAPDLVDIDLANGLAAVASYNHSNRYTTWQYLPLEEIC